jgi:hypothetical protein
VERYSTTFADEASEQSARLLQLRERGCGSCGAKNGFGEAGCGNRHLLGARSVEHKSGGIDPIAQKVEGEEGLRVVTPVREACSGKLAGRWSYGGVQRNAFLPGAVLGAAANPRAWADE